MPIRSGNNTTATPGDPTIYGVIAPGNQLTIVPGVGGTPSGYYLYRNGHRAGIVANGYFFVEADCSGYPFTVRAFNAAGVSSDSNALVYTASLAMSVTRANLKPSSITADGANNVTAWNDVTGVGNNFAPTGTIVRGADFNGMAGRYFVRGDGLSGFVRKVAFSFGAAVSEFSVIIVGVARAAAGDRIWFHYQGGGNQIPYAYAQAAFAESPKLFGPGNVTNVAAESALIPQVLVFSWDGATQKIYSSTRLGSSIVNVNAGPPDGASFTLFASAAGALFLDGDMVEVLVRRKASTTSDIRGYSYYARCQYDIPTLTLPYGDSIVYGLSGDTGGWRPATLTACAAVHRTIQFCGDIDAHGLCAGYPGRTLAYVVANLPELDTLLTVTQASRFPSMFTLALGVNDAIAAGLADPNVTATTMLNETVVILNRVLADLPLLTPEQLALQDIIPPEGVNAFAAPACVAYNAGIPALLTSMGIPLRNRVNVNVNGGITIANGGLDGGGLHPTDAIGYPHMSLYGYQPVLQQMSRFATPMVP